MKKLARILLSVLSAVLVFGAVGCNKTIHYDETKTQLFVQTYDGGFGTAWLDKVKARFESEFAGYELNGKTGVEIIVTANTDMGSTVDEMFATNINDVFFTEQSPYLKLLQNKRMLDITDILTDELTEWGENGNILSKMPQEQKNYFGIKQADGSSKYYGLSYGNAFQGLIYDEDLFYREGLFYSKAYDDDPTVSRSNRFVAKIPMDNAVGGKYSSLVTENGVRYYKTVSGEYLSKGPDGVYGTDDDGQPATYADMFVLCDYMMAEGDNITPFLWLGKDNSHYLGWFFTQLAADYEGREQAALGYSFSGKAKNLISVDGSTVTPLPETEIRPGNELDVFKSAGKYYAASFMEKIFKGGYASGDCFNSSNYHSTAQQSFIYSLKDSEKFAFLFDGVWWENEADTEIGKMADKFGAIYAKSNRNFKLLHMPKATGAKVGEKATILDTHNMVSFIRSDIGAKEELAKKFLQFCFTDKSNKEFTVTTGAPRPLKYELTDAELSQMSTFAKSAWGVHTGYDIVYPYSQNAFYAAKASLLGTTPRALIDHQEYMSLTEMFNTKKFTAAQVFNGIYAQAVRNLG